MTPHHFTPPPDTVLNRELSWLAFNERVLGEAEDERVPLLERIKFLSIASNNWDEFFMVRVAGVWRQIDAGIVQPGPDGLTPKQVLTEIARRVHGAVARQHQLFLQSLQPKLEEAGVFILPTSSLDAAQADYVADIFERTLLPVITPLAVDMSHPFPRLGNRALVLVAELEPEENAELESGGLPGTELCFIPVPTNVSSRFLRLPSAPGTHVFVLLEDVIRAHLTKLFDGYQVVNCRTIRATRDSDVPIEEDATDDLMKAVEEGLRSRRRGAVVRVQFEEGLSPTILEALVEQLELLPEDLYPTQGFISFSDLMQLYAAVDLPDMKYPPMALLHHPAITYADSMFDAIRDGDLLLHHPHHAYDPVVRFVREAADDPAVLAIKMTLYRMTPDSLIAEALERAAERGKQVAVVVELRARFDEASNIIWAKRLEKAGAHVVYGIPNFKTHCKACLVVRMEEGAIRRYCHLATGNYNERTARLYDDFSYFTTRSDFGEDVSHLFNLLPGYTRPPRFKQPVLAPKGLRQMLLDRIQRERTHAQEGRSAGMVLKMNALVDPQLISALYEASGDGVRVDLIVRGACCLRPGVPGLSERIRVISILDRFLEHARIYQFHNAGDEELLLSSADLMPRNLDHRVEVAFPLLDPLLRNQVKEMLDFQLQDTEKARVLGPQGEVLRVGLDAAGPPLRSQIRVAESLAEAMAALEERYES